MVEITKLNQTPECGIRRVPLADLLKQHRTRYLVHTSVGDVIMRHITYMDTEQTVLEIADAIPEYLKLVREGEMLRDISKFDKGLDAMQMARLIEIGQVLEPFAKRFALRCFVDPILNTVEELDALLSVLNSDERDAILALMSKLSSSSDGKADLNVVMALKEMGITLPHDLTIESITSEQAAAFVSNATEMAHKGGKK